MSALLAIMLLLTVTGGVEDRNAPEQRAEALLKRMTEAEKVTLLHGGAACGYVGCVDGIERLGIPPLHLQDGPAGVGGGLTGVTQLPAPVAAAAAWDPAVMRAYGQVLGAEHRGKGADVVLAPTVNIVRDPRWGRAFESLGEDPYLSGVAAAAEIGGIRSAGPMAQVKHYAVYNQETGRNTPASDATIDERTLREIYLPAFAASVAAGAESVMCAYNPVNGVYPCENAELQEHILRGELGFRGFITSDWDATHSSARNGLDMEMPASEYFGGLAGRDVDVSVRRILTAMFRNGMFDADRPGSLTARVTTAAHAVVAREVAEQGSVLLKNDQNLLPVRDDARAIAVIGSAAGTAVLSQGGGSARVDPEYVVSPCEGLRERAGDRAEVTCQPGVTRADGALPTVPGLGLTGAFFAGTGLAGTPFATRTDATLDGDWRTGDPGTGRPSQWSARWTGYLTPPATGTYTFSLTNSGGARLRIGDRTLVDNGWDNRPRRTGLGTITLTAGARVPVTVEFAHYAGSAALTLGWTLPGQRLHDDAVAAARTADLSVVVVGRGTAEGADLPDISLSPAENALVRDVAAVNPNTVVVVNSGSAVALPWAGSVRAIVAAWYPGQEYGHALARLLFGDTDFTGRLPVTFPRTLADVPAATPEQWPGGVYSEGLKVGYRWYDATGKQPLFPFGHGLSYTTFSYSGLRVSRDSATVEITNTGVRPGTETPQVYVNPPPATGEPPQALAGFTKVTLAPGESRRVTIPLNPGAFEQWTSGRWQSAPGSYGIAVGASSRDIRLRASVDGS
ncbi:beta-glucosidase [Symbioplanes lichenis]|uniref:beta-glucosidase n=1 Tax=Symbioplanes lichenis TaxID=1629072 RepID=UPI002739BA85|nr:glycoside hydrolase family 3 C-terminal domain-containing protein [Actinoplanes lichenis]